MQQAKEPTAANLQSKHDMYCELHKKERIGAGKCMFYHDEIAGIHNDIVRSRLESLLLNEVIKFEGEDHLDRVQDKLQEVESHLKLKFTRAELADVDMLGINQPDI